MSDAPADDRVRCGWIDRSRLSPEDFVLYRDYHDTEWGRPLRDSAALRVGFPVLPVAFLRSTGPLPAQAQVDHFVPWSRFPADFGHNFLLAHERCNAFKSDHLAAENHLALWITRNREHQAQFQERLASAALPGEREATAQIARWVYGQVDQVNGRVWVIDKVLKRLDPDWACYFAAGGETTDPRL